MFLIIQQQTEEDPDEGVKDLVEMTLKKMVCFKNSNVLNNKQNIKFIVIF